MRQTFFALAALAALGLAACNDNRSAGGGTGGAARFCTPFSAAAPADPSGATDDCLHRWAYSLAASPDPADQVAQATVAACNAALTRWNQQTLALGAQGAVEAPSLLTGQPTAPIAEHMSFSQSRALFYVVQARAGKCAPPPAAANTSGAVQP
jgi:hypothetical protein